MHGLLSRQKLLCPFFRNQQILRVIKIEVCDSLNKEVFDSFCVVFDIQLVVHDVLLFGHELKDDEAHHLVDVCHF